MNLTYSRVLNHTVGLREVNNGSAYDTSYAYDIDDRPTTIQYGVNTRKVVHEYDESGRASARKVYNGATSPILTTTYSYLGGDTATYGTNATTELVTSISQTNFPLSYGYDMLGRITSETRGGLATTYTYDAGGQLTRVNDPHDNSYGASGQSWVYNYDRGGNLTSKVRYAYTTGTLGAAQATTAYAYGDANWKDKVTSIGGQALTYDAIGNLTNDGTWTYTWQGGRQLKQMSKTGQTITYTYGPDGLRSAMNVGSTAYNYQWAGTRLTHLTIPSHTLHFFHDGTGRPALVNYNGAYYHYVYNLVGDVIALVDRTGATVVEYKYDAWGRKISTTGSLSGTLGQYNPFRYRRYIYDEATKLYYLRARCYDPATSRMLPEDPARDGLNWHIYANNNPLKYIDPSGLVPKEVADQRIKDNAGYIISAANQFGVNPGILAATIYAEQILNFNSTEGLEDWTQMILGMDCSVGISQVRISTAKSIEDAGYMSVTRELIIYHTRKTLLDKELMSKCEVVRNRYIISWQIMKQI